MTQHIPKEIWRRGATYVESFKSKWSGLMYLQSDKDTPRTIILSVEDLASIIVAHQQQENSK